MSSEKELKNQDLTALDRPFVYVSGKGGVGKSLVAAAIAATHAAKGSKTLLVETGDRSYYQDFLNLPAVDHHPRPSGLGFDIALWSGESCLREYVLHLLKLERLYKIFFENKVMRALVNVAPGLTEIAVLGKITSGVRHVGPPLSYDRIVIDMPATGHALAMFRAPEGMAHAIQFGPMASHCNEMSRLLHESTMSSLVLVSLLEELPVAESEEFAAAVTSEFKMPIQVVANRCLDMDLSISDLREIENLKHDTLSDYARGLAMTLEAQAQQLARLRSLPAARERGVLMVPKFFSLTPAQMIASTKEALSNVSTKY